MIVAKLFDRTIGVTFQHGQYTVARNPHIKEEPGQRRFTRATIWELKDGDPHWRKYITSATVRCYYKDKMTREDGRKKALKAAFAKVADQIGRPSRGEFWTQYHQKSAKRNPLK